MEITDLLKMSVEKRGSDLHVIPNMPPLLRIDGDITPLDVPVLTPEDTKRLIYSTMNTTEQQEFETNLVLDLAVSYPEIGNFRQSAYHQLNGIAGVFRVISSRVPTFDQLKSPPILKSILALDHGLILIAGPTGCGKSTTLAAMLEFINTMYAHNVITIEDPIEYRFQPKRSNINQIQVGRDTPNFAVALRASLRQDPDVIMVGEMRDLETVRLALAAGETGHLVLSTIHASSAPLAVSRIIDSFPTEEKNQVRNLLSETLQAVICQTLVKKLTGGRAAAFEIMLATPGIRHLIRQDKISHMETAIQTNGHLGMCSFDQSLQELVSKQIISASTARAISSSRGLAS